MCRNTVDQKAWIRPEMSILVMHEQEAYFEWVGTVTQKFAAEKEISRFIHLFATSTAKFTKELVSVLKFYKKNTSEVVWKYWYKLRSGIVTVLSENIIWKFALQNNMVDVKICAVSNGAD